jgi:hypothetical protein
MDSERSLDNINNVSTHACVTVYYCDGFKLSNVLKPQNKYRNSYIDQFDYTWMIL